jgi:hypothetical protein
MTKRSPVIRFSIIIIATVALAFLVRELFYFREVNMIVSLAKVEQAELIQRSSIIVRGTVEKRAGTIRYWNNQGELGVDTRWKIRVSETLKGNTMGEITVRSDGGRYLLTHISVEPTVQFSAGESVLLFLEPHPEGDYRAVGSIQGHYTIQEDQAVQQGSGERTPLADLENLVKAQ